MWLAGNRSTPCSGTIGSENFSRAEVTPTSRSAHGGGLPNTTLSLTRTTVSASANSTGPFFERRSYRHSSQRSSPAATSRLRLRWDYGQCQRVPQQMEQIKRTGGRPGPTFLFAHILLPHEPYVFDSEGRCLSLAEMDARGPKAGYGGQIHYANTLLQDVLASLLNRPGKKPIRFRCVERRPVSGWERRSHRPPIRERCS